MFWAHDGPMTVRQVHTALCERGLAYTTILTTMVRMMEKGWLSRAAGNVEEACARLGADRRDRTEALAVLLGVGVKW